MNDTSGLSDGFSATNLAIGILLGAALGVATSFLFLLIIVGPLLGVALAIAGLRGGPDGRRQANVGGGLLIGMGIVYLLEAINTLISCQGHEDVCGGASALPFLGLAIAVLAAGILLEGITIARVR
jgi:hypothetical protein